MSDGVSDSNEATVAIAIIAVNDPAVAAAGSLTLLEDQPAAGQLQATDVDSASLTFSIVSPPARGVATLEAATGAYSYTPNPNANGVDSFSFQAADGPGSRTSRR